jgi:polyhydroxyalkanoate synthase subunit PhaC
LAALDVAVHLADSPAYRTSPGVSAALMGTRLAEYAVRRAVGKAPPVCVRRQTGDRRFGHPSRQRWPFDVLAQAFLLGEQWWQEATVGVEGVSTAHANQVAFVARQVLDMCAPSNFLAANPEVQDVTLREGGGNLVRGAARLAADSLRTLRTQPSEGAPCSRWPPRPATCPRGGSVYKLHLSRRDTSAPTPYGPGPRVRLSRSPSTSSSAPAAASTSVRPGVSGTSRG